MTLEQFTEYFNDFYGVEGLYPTDRNYTQEEILKGIENLTQLPERKGIEFEGDSLDREHLRTVIIGE